MKKLLIYLGLMIILAFGVSAEIETNESFNINAIYTEDGVPTYINLTTITIELPNGEVDVNNSNMTNIGVGEFTYIYTPQYAGIYNVIIKYYNDSLALQGITEGTFNVDLADRLQWGVCPESKLGRDAMWIMTILLFVIGIVGMIIKLPILTVISAFGLIFMTLIIWGCGAILGSMTIIFGLVFLLIAVNSESK